MLGKWFSSHRAPYSLHGLDSLNTKPIDEVWRIWYFSHSMITNMCRLTFTQHFTWHTEMDRDGPEIIQSQPAGKNTSPSANCQNLSYSYIVHKESLVTTYIISDNVICNIKRVQFNSLLCVSMITHCTSFPNTIIISLLRQLISWSALPGPEASGSLLFPLQYHITAFYSWPHPQNSCGEAASTFSIFFSNVLLGKVFHGSKRRTNVMQELA